MKHSSSMFRIIFAVLCFCHASEGNQETSISVATKLGAGFGKILVIEGVLDHSKQPTKGLEYVRFNVLKINGESIKTPISVKLQMLNKASSYEFDMYSKAQEPTALILLGYESLSATGIPDGVNQTLETMEQTSKWNIETYFVLVRISKKSDGWPEIRNGVRMNQVKHFTYD